MYNIVISMFALKTFLFEKKNVFDVFSLRNFILEFFFTSLRSYD